MNGSQFVHVRLSDLYDALVLSDEDARTRLQAFAIAEQIARTGHAFRVETVLTTSGVKRKIGRCACGWESPMSKTTQGAEKTARNHHPQAFCPTPNKRRFSTREAAARALLEFWQTAGTGKKELRRAYECECGYWHTTSQPGQDILSAPTTHEDYQYCDYV